MWYEPEAALPLQLFYTEIKLCNQIFVGKNVISEPYFLHENTDCYCKNVMAAWSVVKQVCAGSIYR